MFSAAHAGSGACLPPPTPNTSHPLAALSQGLKKLIKRIEKQEAAEQEAERRSVEANEP